MDVGWVSFVSRIAPGKRRLHRPYPTATRSPHSTSQPASACRSRVNVEKLRTGCGSRSALTATNNSLSARVDSSGIRMQDRQCVTSSFALPGHLLLRQCRSDARSADTKQTPNRDRRRKPANVITHLYATPDPRFRPGFFPNTSVAAGCSRHATGSDYHRSTRVPLHPVWPKAASSTLWGTCPVSMSDLAMMHPSRTICGSYGVSRC
jgi:hypothetical protein